MSSRLQLIDELTRREHYHLTDEDECAFFGEYTARMGFAFSETNQLIGNLKKKMHRRGNADWQYKERAIRRVADIFRSGLQREFLARVTIVPMPPSMVKTDPMYDDRMLQVARLMGAQLDIRELVLMRHSLVPSHERSDRPSPEELYDDMYIDAALCDPVPTDILLIDDVLTAGSHFVAAKRRLKDRFPGARVIGLFAARRALETDDFDDVGNI